MKKVDFDRGNRKKSTASLEQELSHCRDLAGAGPGNWLPKSGYRSRPRAEYRIDLGDVRTVEQVEEFRYHVEAFHTAELEVLQEIATVLSVARGTVVPDYSMAVEGHPAHIA